MQFFVPKHFPCALLTASQTHSKNCLNAEPMVSKIHQSGLSGVNTQIFSCGSKVREGMEGENYMEIPKANVCWKEGNN